jgi:hypothetical protein
VIVFQYMKVVVYTIPKCTVEKKKYKQKVFYGRQYDLYDRLKKDSYVIENDLYVRIRGSD